MQTQEEKDEDLAFEQGFNSVNAADPAPPQVEPAKADPEPAPDPVASMTPVNPAVVPPAEPTTPVEDPFASLPPQVRDLLARVPALEARLEQTTRVANMVPALQSRIDKLSQGTPATEQSAPAAPRFPKVEALRKELPEISDALDEIADAYTVRPRAQAQQPTPEPTPVTGPTEAEVALDDARPNWGADLIGADFQLWLTQQPRELQDTVRTTNRAGPLLQAFKQFDAYKDKLKNVQQLGTNRATRMAAGVTPQGDGRRIRQAAKAVDDEDAAIAEGFARVRGNRR